MNQNNETKRDTKSENLDLEFKKILCVIREHIPFINSNAYLMQCRLWLEKLSGQNVNKLLRNMYLLELCGQIQNNKLLPPFNEAPPTGHLKGLSKFLLRRKSCRPLCQDLKLDKNRMAHPHTSMANIPEKDVLDDNSATTSELLCPNNTDNWDSLEHFQYEEKLTSELLCPNNTENWDSLERFQYEKKLSEDNMPAEKLKLEINLPMGICCQDEEKSQSDSPEYDNVLQNNNFNCGEPVKHVNNDGCQTKNKSKEKSTVNTEDDGSWSDLTDASSAIGIPQQEDEFSVSTNSTIGSNSSSTPHNSSKSVTCTQSTMKIDGLTKPLQLNNIGFEDLKCPKDTNFISEDWKNTVHSLQLRLSEMAHQNNQLTVFIQKLENQIEEIKNNHKEDMKQRVSILENLHSQEILKLKTSHTDAIKNLERSYEITKEKLYNEYQDKLKKTITSYEEKISRIKEEKDGITKFKDEEIRRLTEVIQQQCKRITNDISNLQNQVSVCNCDKKLLLLKKCVSKMDKLFQRSENEYMRQIENLRQELEAKNAALQIQLRMQKSELMAEVSSERQEEFDKVLNSLEVKYIKMLESHENQIMDIKKQDDEKIQSLKELLSKHGILYDEHHM